MSEHTDDLDDYFDFDEDEEDVIVHVDYTDVIIVVHNGSVQSAHLRDGTPITVTVHDYDVPCSNPCCMDRNIDCDDLGDKFERLIV